MMKKVVLSLFLAVIWLPVAFAQGGSHEFVSVNEVACGAFTWDVNGVTYTHDTVVTHVTVDTIYVLDLTVSSGNTDTAMVIDVEGTCFGVWHGHKIYTPGTQLYTVPSLDGCDTIVKLNVTLSGFSDTAIAVASCGSYTASWGEKYTTGGTKVHADSNLCVMTTLDLTVNPEYKDSSAVVVESVEAGCYYKFGGINYTDSNVTHYALLKSVAGCDSLAAIRITHFTHEQVENNVVEYCGNNYIWPVSGRGYTQAGSYDTVVFNADSTCRTTGQLTLTFAERDSVINAGPYCAQKSYSFRNSASYTYNRTFTESGHFGYVAESEFEDYVQDTNLYIRNLGTGCLTRIALNIEIIAPEQRYNDTIDTVSCDQFVFRVGANARQTYTESGTYSLTYERHLPDQVITDNSACYDLTGVVNLTINPSTGENVQVFACDSYTWSFNGVTYTKDTVGTVTLRDSETNEKIKNMYGCDSVGKITLTVNKTPEAYIDGKWMLQPGEETVLKAVCSMNGVSYRWEKDGGTVSTADSIVIVAPENEEENGNISVTLITSKSYAGGNSCVSNSWLTVVTLFPNGIDDVESLDVNIYPNPASHMVNINSEVTISEVVLYDMAGRRILGSNGEGNNVQVDLSSVANGNYMMQITAVDGSVVNRKLVVSK